MLNRAFYSNAGTITRSGHVGVAFLDEFFRLDGATATRDLFADGDRYTTQPVHLSHIPELNKYVVSEWIPHRLHVCAVCAVCAV